MGRLLDIRRIVKDYYTRLLYCYENKEDTIEIESEIIESYSDAEIFSIVEKLTYEAEEPFELFAVAKYALTYFTQNDRIFEHKIFFPKWLESCTSVGAYEDCLHFTTMIFVSKDWDKLIDTREGILICLRRAKALRNIGRFQESLEYYRKAIKMAEKISDTLYINIGLLLIGKLYGNYLGQRSLFSSFVEEAKAGLESEYNNCGKLQLESQKFIKYIAICYDALGQAYDLADPARAENYFKTAIQWHGKIESENGVTRAKCHLNRLKFQFADSLKDQKLFLSKFEKALEDLAYDSMEERGLGIRWIQYALLLNQVNQVQEAITFFEEGKKIAIKYSDYKTIAWASIVESEIYKDSNFERSVNTLLFGQKIAKQYNLLLRESEINLKLAKLSVHKNYKNTNLTELFERNREISRSFISEVKQSWILLDSQENSKPEFGLFSSATKNNFRYRILLDFYHTVDQLDSNIQTLTKALRAKERRQQELLILGVVNSVARELLHEVKVVIPENSTISPIKEVHSNLNEAISFLQRGEHSSDKISFDKHQFNKIVGLLEDQSGRINAFGEKMASLKNLLSNRLKRPRHFDEIVSLQTVCYRAVEELRNSNTFNGNSPKFEFECDIELKSNEEMMITVVQSLIRNAYEAFTDLQISKGIVLIQLYSEPVGDFQYGNPSRVGVLAVVNQVIKQEDAISLRIDLEKGLEGNTTKLHGSGVGLEVANTVFIDLMKANFELIYEPLMSGLKVTFSTGNGRAKIISNKNKSMQ